MSLSRVLLAIIEALFNELACTPPNRTLEKDRYDTDTPSIFRIGSLMFRVRLYRASQLFYSEPVDSQLGSPFLCCIRNLRLPNIPPRIPGLILLAFLGVRDPVSLHNPSLPCRRHCCHSGRLYPHIMLSRARRALYVRPHNPSAPPPYHLRALCKSTPPSIHRLPYHHCWACVFTTLSRQLSVGTGPPAPSALERATHRGDLVALDVRNRPKPRQFGGSADARAVHRGVGCLCGSGPILVGPGIIGGKAWCDS
jgi:hypothetical protein